MNIALLLAAGSSRRCRPDKLFAELGGMPIVAHSIETLNASTHVDAIFIAANRGNKKRLEALVKKGKFLKVSAVILGAKTRAGSVKKLIAAASSVDLKKTSRDVFIVHNAANPLATQNEIAACVRSCRGLVSGAAVGRPLSATLKKVGTNGVVTETIPRANLFVLETPQVVDAEKFVAAYKKLGARALACTDDLEVLERAGYKTRVVEASGQNIKITTHHDLTYVRALTGEPPAAYLIGYGEDSHAFLPLQKRKIKGSSQCLMLGGVKIPSLPALDADSDGDVILHALCNALASAICQKSLGSFATALCARGVRDSCEYVGLILQKVTDKNLYVVNCAVAIEGVRPAIDPLAGALKKHISTLLRIPPAAVGITATTGKNLTPFGRGEGLRAAVTVLLTSQN